ncbi:hypothetical protein MLD38_010710 [Melastoma candidum]|uniref:Uncharacterized protein n=1 Tax=Melastoma candidum TaxID=119954 RepID=A0ACB9R1U1_9MYRT|nr:hypothetical protein MLD38_010710 [Melastoma candidum]
MSVVVEPRRASVVALEKSYVDDDELRSPPKKPKIEAQSRQMKPENGSAIFLTAMKNKVKTMMQRLSLAPGRCRLANLDGGGAVDLRIWMMEPVCLGLVDGVWSKVVADVDIKATVAHPGGGMKTELVAGTTVARPDGGVLTEFIYQSYGCSLW